MDIKLESEDSTKNEDEQRQPLLRNAEVPEAERNLIQKAISQTFQSTAHLANLLPTGTVLAFQLLSPIFTNIGNCDSVSKSMTAALVALCGASCFLLCLTDSFRDNKGNICYGFATLRGLWVIDGSTTLPPQLAAKYRLKFIDFMHAIMSVLVFSAIALFDQNVVSCFFPAPSNQTQEVLTALPVGIGVLGSMFFVAFPKEAGRVFFNLTLPSPEDQDSGNSLAANMFHIKVSRKVGDEPRQWPQRRESEVL